MALGLFPWGLGAQEPTSGARAVTYAREQIFDVKGDVVELLGGSKWRTAGPTVLLPATEVILVLESDPRFAMLYADRVQEAVYHLTGEVVPNAGTLTTVVRELGDGAVLMTADGGVWEVPSYDRYDTGWWLPPYPVLITRDELYIINLKRLKRVWVSRRE